MTTLFERHARLFEGYVYERDVYGRRPGCDPDLICRGLEPITDNTPERLAERIRIDRAKYARVVKMSGATAE